MLYLRLLWPKIYNCIVKCVTLVGSTQTEYNNTGIQINHLRNFHFGSM